jgi:hypothetical protein
VSASALAAAFAGRQKLLHKRGSASGSGGGGGGGGKVYGSLKDAAMARVATTKRYPGAQVRLPAWVVERPPPLFLAHRWRAARRASSTRRHCGWWSAGWRLCLTRMRVAGQGSASGTTRG